MRRVQVQGLSTLREQLRDMDAESMERLQAAVRAAARAVTDEAWSLRPANSRGSQPRIPANPLPPPPARTCDDATEGGR